jgi:hypothetical protein
MKNNNFLSLTQRDFSPSIINIYDNTRQYHDGKWLWIKLHDPDLIDDVERLIAIKRKPKTLECSKI